MYAENVSNYIHIYIEIFGKVSGGEGEAAEAGGAESAEMVASRLLSWEGGAVCGGGLWLLVARMDTHTD